MKKTLLALFGVLAVIPSVCAQSDEDQEEHESDDNEELPECAVTCINKGIDVGETQNCEGEADLACLCANPDVGVSVRDCAYTECSTEEDREAIIEYVFHVCEEEAGVTITVPTESPTGLIASKTDDSSPSATATDDSEPTDSPVSTNDAAFLGSSVTLALFAAAVFAGLLA